VGQNWWFLGEKGSKRFLNWNGFFRAGGFRRGSPEVELGKRGLGYLKPNSV